MSAHCYHGGAFFSAIGPEFQHLERRHHIINADVLDAWFDPSPKVVAALTEPLPWLLRTSPPTHGEGLIRAIARARGVPGDSILPGAGSSDLIFLALREWLTRDSRVLILDPMYGEYAHVLESVIECHVDRLTLERANHYRVNLDQLQAATARNYDLIILVNPNSPTGQHILRVELENVLRAIPANTRVWVDETYIDYTDGNQSLETEAAASENLFICKSLSKVYALSGARAAYLCGPRHSIAALRHVMRPWAVSLPAQVAAVAALTDAEYYAARWQETHRLRSHLAAALEQFAGWEVLPGVANFLLCHLPTAELNAAELVQQCRTQGLFLRDVGGMGRTLGRHALRLAVKDAATNARMVEILRRVRNSNAHSALLSPAEKG